MKKSDRDVLNDLLKNDKYYSGYLSRFSTLSDQKIHDLVSGKFKDRDSLYDRELDSLLYRLEVMAPFIAGLRETDMELLKRLWCSGVPTYAISSSSPFNIIALLKDNGIELDQRQEKLVLSCASDMASSKMSDSDVRKMIADSKSIKDSLDKAMKGISSSGYFKYIVNFGRAVSTGVGAFRDHCKFTRGTKLTQSPKAEMQQISDSHPLQRQKTLGANLPVVYNSHQTVKKNSSGASPQSTDYVGWAVFGLSFTCGLTNCASAFYDICTSSTDHKDATKMLESLRNDLEDIKFNYSLNPNEIDLPKVLKDVSIAMRIYSSLVCVIITAEQLRSKYEVDRNSMIADLIVTALSAVSQGIKICKVSKLLSTCCTKEWVRLVLNGILAIAQAIALGMSHEKLAEIKGKLDAAKDAIIKFGKALDNILDNTKQ